MVKLVKRLILSVATVLVATVTVLALALQYLNWNDHRDALARWLSVAINREVTISDSLDFQLWPVTRLGVSGLRLASPADTFDVDLLELKNGVIEFDLWSLFSGIAVIDRLQLDGPTLQLAVSADGQANWHFDREKPPGEPPSALGQLVARNVLIKDARLVFAGRDPRLHQDLYLESLTLTLPSGADDGQVKLKGEVKLKGSLSEEGLTLEVKGPLKLKGDDLEASLDLTLGAVTGKVSGKVSDLMEGGNTNLSVSLKTEDLTQSVSIFLPGLTERSGKLFSGTAEATAVMRGQLGRDLRLDDIEVTTRSEHLRITASGSISSLGDFFKESEQGSAVSPTRLQVLAETKQLGKLVRFYNGDVPFEASAEARGILTGSLRNFRIDDVVVTASGEHADLQASGYLEKLGSPGGPWVDFGTEVSTDQLGRFVKSHGLDIPYSGRGFAQGRVSGARGDVHVRGIDLELESSSMTLKAGGTIGPIGPEVQFNMPFTIDARDLAGLAKPLGVLGEKVPTGFSGHAQARLVGERKALNISEIKLAISSDIVTINAGGSVESLGPNAECDLDVDASVVDIGAMGRLLELPLDDYSAIGAKGSARIQHTAERTSLTKLRGTLAGDGIRNGRFSGEVPDITQLGASSLAIDVELVDIGRFAQQLHINPSYADSVKLKASLVGAPEPNAPYFLTLDIKTDALRARIHGQVTALEKGTGFNLKGSLETDDVIKLNHLLNSELPGAGPLSLDGTIHRADGVTQPLKGRLNLDATDIKASVAGDIAWPLRSGMHVDARIEAKSLANLDAFLPGKFPDLGPVAFSGSLSLDDEGLHSDHFSLTVANNNLDGSLSINGLNIAALPQLQVAKDDKLRLSGELNSKRLSLIELFPVPPETRKKSSTEGPVFSDTPLPLGWVKGVDLDVALKAGQLIGRKAEAGNLSASIQVLDGVLTVNADSGQLSGGQFDMDLRVDARGDLYNTKLDFKIEKMEIEQIPELRDKDLPIRGQVNVDIELAGQGKSLKQMLAGANGSVFMSASDAYIPASGLDFLTQSIISQIFRVVSQKKKSEYHDIECGLIGFRIIDGVAISRDTIVIKTPDVAYLVQGGLHFEDESIVLAIQSKALKGLGVSAASLVPSLRVVGTLTEPRRSEPDLEGAVKTGATWGLAAITAGGWIVAQGLVDRFTGNLGVCEAAQKNYDDLLLDTRQEVLQGATDSDNEARASEN
jgi:uncharacterized protein involved in outer membrane biogenesis